MSLSFALPEPMTDNQLYLPNSFARSLDEVRATQSQTREIRAEISVQAAIPLDLDQIEYSTQDIANALGQGMTAKRVRHHCRKVFPNRGGQYRFTLTEATRLLKYIERNRHKQSQQSTIILLAEHLKRKGL